MYGTHAANRLVEDRAACAVGPAVSLLPKRRRWESNPLELLCRQPPCRLAPAPSCPVSSPGVEPGLRPSQGRVQIRHTPRTCSHSAPRRGIEPRLAVSSTAVLIRHTRRASFKCLDQESNLDLDLRRVLCDPLHHRDIQHPDLESNQDQGLRRALCDPLHHRDSTHQSRRLDLHQHRCGLQDRRLSVRPRRQQAASAEESNPVAAALETASSPRSTLLYRPPALRPGAFGVTTTLAASRSSTLR